MNIPDYILPGFIINRLCFQTNPCQHDVIIDGCKKRMCAIEIYQLCINNEYEVPEHFKYCGVIIDKFYCHDLIKKDNFEEFKEKCLFANKHDRNSFLSTACEHGRINFIKYLVDEENTPVEYDHLIKFIKNKNSLDIFKYLLEKSDVKPSEKSTTHYIGHGGNNLLSFVAYHNNLALAKYLLEDLNITLVQPKDYVKPLLEAFNNKDADMNEMKEYLIKKSIEQHDIYYGDDVINLQNVDLYDLFVSHGLIYNSNGKINVEIESYNGNIDIDLEKVDFEYAIKPLIHSNLHDTENYNCRLSVLKDAIKSIEISVKTNIDNAIKNILLVFSGTNKKFNKIIDVENSISKFKLEFKDPLCYYLTPFTKKNLLFEIDRDLSNDIFIKNIDIKILSDVDHIATNFDSNKKYIMIVDEHTDYIIHGTSVTFVDKNISYSSLN